MNKISVMIASPCYGGMINCNTAGAIFLTGQILAMNNIHNEFRIIQNESFIVNARNRIAHEFMQSEHTHILCVDADIGFNPHDVMKLVNYGEDFVGVPYRVKSEIVRFACSENYVGLGFCLLSKKVFNALNTTVDKLRPQRHWNTTQMVSNYYGPIVENQEMMAEDYSFCKRCVKNNIKIHIIKEIELTHYGQFGYTGKYNA